MSNMIDGLSIDDNGLLTIGSNYDPPSNINFIIKCETNNSVGKNILGGLSVLWRQTINFFVKYFATINRDNWYGYAMVSPNGKHFFFVLEVSSNPIYLFSIPDFISIGLPNMGNFASINVRYAVVFSEDSKYLIASVLNIATNSSITTNLINLSTTERITLSHTARVSANYDKILTIVYTITIHPMGDRTHHYFLRVYDASTDNLLKIGNDIFIRDIFNTSPSLNPAFVIFISSDTILLTIDGNPLIYRIYKIKINDTTGLMDIVFIDSGTISLGHTSTNSINMPNNKKYLMVSCAIGSDLWTIALYDIQSMVNGNLKEILRWQSHSSAINHNAFSPTNRYIYNRGMLSFNTVFPVITIYDIINGSPLNINLPQTSFGATITIRFFKDDRYALIAFNSSNIFYLHVYDIENKKFLNQNPSSMPIRSTNGDFTPNGKFYINNSNSNIFGYTVNIIGDFFDLNEVFGTSNENIGIINANPRFITNDSYIVFSNNRNSFTAVVFR